MKRTLVSLAALGAIMSAGLATTPALAGSDGAPQVQIDYRDLNLATPEGQKALNRRVNSAAREICGIDKARTGTRVPSQSAAKCYKAAKQQASRQMAVLIENERLGG